MTKRAEIKLRLTEQLRRKVERAARQSGVSMNAEMIKRLERSFEENHYGQGEAA